MNEHIDKYLKEYIELGKPEFAVLLTGKWGSGKTYFIDTFMTKIENKIEFIKISFFGISNKDDLQHEIIIKLLGINNNSDLIKKGSKVGAKIINSFGKKLGLSIYDIPIGEILNKINKKIVFIFDDLERASISLHEILGHINGYVEILKFNVIILANELEIDDAKYQKFKEKVIGKTFEVQHNFEEVLTSFTTKELKGYINDDNKKVIKSIYDNAGYNNLRHIKQTLLDFAYFINLIDEEYTGNEKFMSSLIKYFFIFSIELKGSKLYEKNNLLRYKDDVDCGQKEKECKDEKDKCQEERIKCDREEMDKFYKKHNIEQINNMLLPVKVWIKIIFKTSITKVEINKSISSLSLFLVDKKEEKKQPSWVKLQDYRELENDDFEITLKDVLEKFNSLSYDNLEHFLRVIDLLIFFQKNGLSTFTLKEVEEQGKKYIEKYKTTIGWKDRRYGELSFPNDTGLEYMNEENNLSKSFDLMMEENNEIYIQDKIKKIQTLIQAIGSWDESCIEELLLSDNERNPIFQHISAKSLTKQINKISNKNIQKLEGIIKYRYYKYSSFNNEKYYCCFIEELEFWKEMKQEFESSKIAKGLQEYLLKQFEINIIDRLIEKLESCSKNN